MSAENLDFAVLPVQERELEAILGLMETVSEDHESPEIVYRVRPPDSNMVGVVMPVGGVGRVEAAVATGLLLARATPRCLLLVGVAGGFAANGVELGDLVVADRILDYEWQRLSDGGVETRFRVYEAADEILRVARAVEMSDWYHGLPCQNGRAPRTHFGTVLSGDKVIASAAVVEAFLKDHTGLIGAEMEGAGMAATLARHRTRIPWLMVRGVVDLANERKRDDSRVWIEDACDAAAAFTLAVICSLQEEALGTTPDTFGRT
ncbi:5'-methylthioadenosine/S-adenosylhomocysteine nucleosidase [Micromonospora zamorensis]|uniref:5'-methylthioadenosine/S-adenosylhomocysteine nucleosidase family protein n=1 Tax=Micromonospora zamorensis TaxID=709883 RepID=UPI00352B9991|nr:5'-methylthioadenosine/S-adenosylhomocysteine nucleosidase [Micromonospora zamorensis]